MEEAEAAQLAIAAVRIRRSMDEAGPIADKLTVKTIVASATVASLEAMKNAIAADEQQALNGA